MPLKTFAAYDVIHIAKRGDVLSHTVPDIERPHATYPDSRDVELFTGRRVPHAAEDVPGHNLEQPVAAAVATNFLLSVI
jgi:hypothetical protein